MRQVVLIAPLLSVLAHSTIVLAQVAEGGGILYGSEIGVVVTAPKGWLFDTKSGTGKGVPAVMYPTGSTWANANERMYVNIVKSRDETLDSFIAGDIEKFKSASSSLTVEK